MENSSSNHTTKRKRKPKSVDPLDVERQSFRNDNITIDNFSDDILIAILSRMSLRDAVRTSVLSRRWIYLWMLKSGTLDFNNMNVATGTVMEREKFIALVHRVLDLNKGRQVDSLIIRLGFEDRNTRKVDTSDFNEWVYFFMENEVKRFELNLSNSIGYHCCYKFPSIETLLSRKVNKSSLVSLRSLKLVDVDVEDEVVHYFLAECPFLEHLCISASDATKNLEIVDPLPNLKELEISGCWYIQSLVISVTNLVSFTSKGREISPEFKSIPNLTELTLGKEYCQSFICQPNKHSSYSVQLVKLVLNLEAGSFGVQERRFVPHYLPQLYALKRLELNIVSEVSRSLLFFTSLIKASPQLQEFKIKIDYIQAMYGFRDDWKLREMISFPNVTSVRASEFDHKYLKVVEMAGYCGCASEEKFLLQLSKIAPSLEKVVIDTNSAYYRDYNREMYRLKREDGKKPLRKIKIRPLSRFKAKKHAEKFKSSFPSEIKFVIT